MDQALRRERGLVSVEVVRIAEADVEKLRAIRLEALKAHPEAFSADPDYEGARPVELWREAIAKRAWFAAVEGGEWLGIAAFSRETYSKKIAHMGSLGAMYVRAGARGKGVGDALIEAILEEAAKDVEQITLTVNAENKPAIALYERHGFRAYGKAPRSLKTGGKYYDEIAMARAVSPAD
jgi:ribosomal protein S18 acetylase RimI-like enzyme